MATCICCGGPLGNGGRCIGFACPANLDAISILTPSAEVQTLLASDLLAQHAKESADSELAKVIAWLRDSAERGYEEFRTARLRDADALERHAHRKGEK